MSGERTKNQQQQQRSSRYPYTCSACEPHVKYNLICAHLCAKTFITTNIYFKTNCHTHNANKSLNNCVCASERACVFCAFTTTIKKIVFSSINWYGIVIVETVSASTSLKNYFNFFCCRNRLDSTLFSDHNEVATVRRTFLQFSLKLAQFLISFFIIEIVVNMEVNVCVRHVLLQ